MDLQDYLRVVRKRWRIIVAVTCLAVLAAAALTILTPRTYQSTAQLFISTANSETTAELAQGSTFTQKLRNHHQIATITTFDLKPRIFLAKSRRLELIYLMNHKNGSLASMLASTTGLWCLGTLNSIAKATHTANELGRTRQLLHL